MSKSNVDPNHYKVVGRERQGEDIAQSLNKQKHAEDDARRRREFGARSRTPVPQEGAASPEVAPTRAATIAAHAARVAPLKTSPRRTGASPQLAKKLATTKSGLDVQRPDKAIKQPIARKQTTSHGDVGEFPAAGAGALGQGLRRRRREPRI